MNGQGDFNKFGNIFGPNLGRAEDEESNNINTVAFNSDRDGGRMRRSYRHTAYQIQELKNFYEENPLPTKNQRYELGQRLNLEAKQVKIWFQNKRAQAKNNRKHLENRVVIQNNERLLGVHDHLKGAMLGHSCTMYGKATECGDVDHEVQKLKVKNTRLNSEIDDMYSSFLSDPSQVQSHTFIQLPSSSSNPIRNTAPQLDFIRGSAHAEKERTKFLDLANTILPYGLSAKGANELVKLTHRMTLSYYSGITGSTMGKWEIVPVENVAQNMIFMSRKNLNEPGEYNGVVLSAATSVWFPVSQQTLFAFLTNPSYRHEWDILTRDTSMEETIRLLKAKCHGNVISLLRIIRDDMLVLQEVWNDASGALVVYAPVEPSSIELVKRGEDSDSVQFLPSGFLILPDGVADHKGKIITGGGCLLTLGFQILVSIDPTTELTRGFVNSVEGLMVHTIEKIKSALHIQT